MVETRRFLEAATIAKTGGVVLTTKGRDLWEFTVKDQYIVQISSERLFCSCNFNTVYGAKKVLPCKHIIACMIQMSRIWGPVLRERWEDRVEQAGAWYDAMNDEERERFKRRIGWS